MKKTKTSQKNKTPKPNADISTQEITFEPVKIEIENPIDLLLLLKSEEHGVHIQVLYHLKKYLKNANNISSMLEKDLLSYLLHFLSNQDLCIRKLSYAILSHVVGFPAVRDALHHPEWTNAFLQTFSNWEEPLILESLTKILSSITDDQIGKSIIVSLIPLEKISVCLDLDDPDIKKHTLKIILNYLEDETVKSDQLKLETFLKLIDSEYPIIQQLTLNVINSLIKRHGGTITQLKFKELGGFNKLMNYLEKPEYEDLHPHIIEIFGNISVDNGKSEIMEANNLKRLLLLSKRTLNVSKLVMIWETIIKLASSKRNRQILLDYNVMESITTFLKSSNERLIVVACEGVKEFLKDSDQVGMVLANVPIQILTDLMEEKLLGKTKEKIMSALLQFLKFYTVDETNVTELDRFNFILKILASSNENKGISMELLKEVIICLTVLSQNSFYRERIDPNPYIEHLTRHLMESEEDQLRIAIFKCLSQLVYDDSMCQVFCEGYIEKLWKHFEKDLDKIQVSVAVAQFILIASSAQQSAAMAFIRAGTMQWLIEKKKCELLPVWQSVMEKLFEYHLPAKFGFYGRLEFNDIIRDRFYVWRVKEETNKTFTELYPLYDDLNKSFSNDVADSNIIYTVNLQQTSSSSSLLRVSSSSQSSASLSSKKSSDTKSSDEVKTNKKRSSLKDRSKLALSGDPYLRGYINTLGEKIKAEERNSIIEKTNLGITRNIFDTEKQVKMIAQFVCDQLSGTDNGVPCTKHYVELHISDLKMEVRSRMIPLGILRLGLSLERSLLFKVLADQIGVSCALNRGNHGHCWTEVAMVSFDKEPTHIVDLMNAPGKLIKLRSYDADVYKSCPKLIVHH